MNPEIIHIKAGTKIDTNNKASFLQTGESSFGIWDELPPGTNCRFFGIWDELSLGTNRHPTQLNKVTSRDRRQRDHFAIFNIHCCKTSKNSRGPFEEFFSEKSLTMPK